MTVILTIVYDYTYHSDFDYKLQNDIYDNVLGWTGVKQCEAVQPEYAYVPCLWIFFAAHIIGLLYGRH